MTEPPLPQLEPKVASVRAGGGAASLPRLAGRGAPRTASGSSPPDGRGGGGRLRRHHRRRPGEPIHHHLTLPFWIKSGSADAGRRSSSPSPPPSSRSIGVVFSITILALTLASQQFGPRMMRNFVRDVGNQMTLGSLRGHLRLLGAGAGLDHRRPGRRLRPPPLHHGRRGVAPRRPRGAHLLHPPHRQVDPAARGDRRDRRRPPARHRRRVPRIAAGTAGPCAPDAGGSAWTS